MRLPWALTPTLSANSTIQLSIESLTPVLGGDFVGVSFQITAVPEPASIALMALALPGLAFAVVRRRRGYLPCGLEQCN
jgi:hypothetical protein